MVTFFRNSLLIIISSFSLIFSQNHSLSFDGEDDNVSISGGMFNNMEAFSFQSWFYSDGEQSGHSNIIQTNSSLFFARYQPDGQFKINFHMPTSVPISQPFVFAIDRSRYLQPSLIGENFLNSSKIRDWLKSLQL